MAKKIPIGVDDFSELVDPQQNFLFVDKTLMLREIIDQGAKVSLIIRPRRWGKTLNMSMLKYFFSAEVKGRSTQGLFDGLKIAQEKKGEYIQKYQGKNPVILMSFKDLKEKNWTLTLKKLMVLIENLYREFSKILLNNEKTPEFNRIYESIKSKKCDESELKESIKFLSECLYQHYDQKVMILIDEYDTPLNAAYGQPYFEETVNFLKGLFGAALKGNDALEKGVITGILRLSKNRMLSDINNLCLYSFLEEQYSQYFGFSEPEVYQLFAQSDVPLELKEIQRWYNGYRSGNTENVYNPWSIVNCIHSKGALKPYWIKTGDEGLLKSIFSHLKKNLENKLITLLEGHTIDVSIDEYVSFDQIQAGGEEVLWSLLWATGYLKFTEKPTISEMGHYIGFLAIPNHEVACSYRAVFPKWIRTFHQAHYDSFLKNLALGQIEAFVQDLKAYMLTIPSWFDFPRESNYHTFLLGLTASLKETHEIRSNTESGDGRVDLLLIPRNSTAYDLGIILEFKRQPIGKTPDYYEKIATEGLEQINTREYDASLRGLGHIQKILKLCIVFYGKQFSCQSVFEEY